MSNIIVDSFGWMELFQGSEKGKKVLQAIRQNKNEIYTSVLSLYEISYRIQEIKDEKTAEEFIKAIESHAKTLEVDKEISLKAAKIKLENKKLGAVDCLIYATAKTNSLKVLTGDEHFRGLADVVMI